MGTRLLFERARLSTLHPTCYLPGTLPSCLSVPSRDVTFPLHTESSRLSASSCAQAPATSCISGMMSSNFSIQETTDNTCISCASIWMASSHLILSEDRWYRVSGAHHLNKASLHLINLYLWVRLLPEGQPSLLELIECPHQCENFVLPVVPPLVGGGDQRVSSTPQVPPRSVVRRTNYETTLWVPPCRWAKNGDFARSVSPGGSPMAYQQAMR